MRHEIVVNGRFLSRRITGVERYGREILACIGGRSRVEMTRVNGARGHLWEQIVLPVKLPARSILWSPANTGPLWVRNQALTIHDLSPLEHPEWFLKSFSKWYRLFLPILAKRVRVIFTPSEYTKRKVIQRFGVANVIVTPNSVNPSCFHPGACHHIAKLPAKYILFVGSLQPRKNLRTLLMAWNEIKHQYPDLWLIIAGDGGSVFEKTELTSGERIRSMGYVDESDLPGLYAKATLFVLPSLDEGFGLPVLEAMACGTPVIASNGGALPATIDGAGMIFSASAPRGLSQAVCECLENPTLYASLVEKGLTRVKEFSWESTAELVWKTLHEI